jgi:vanillate O-demethylase ferredoxin subunit
MSGPSIELRLRQIRLEAEGICAYDFVAADGAALPAFTAGAHVDLHLPQGMVRSYSLVNAPQDAGCYRIAVQREATGRGGSAWMHEQLRVGQVLRANVPVNDFALDEAAGHSVFIAGGIGITPILSMLARLEALGRSWELHYASRAPERTAFVDALHALDHGRGRVTHCHGTPDSARADIAAIVATADAATHLYCCGPARMIDAFIAAGAARPPRTMHHERFAAASAPSVDGGFEVVLQKSGRRFAVEPGKSILDTLLDHDVSVAYACSSGICGTCRTGVVAGVPDHRDDFLDDATRQANTDVMICCSGSHTPTLVLDL